MRCRMASELVTKFHQVKVRPDLGRRQELLGYQFDILTWEFGTWVVVMWSMLSHNLNKLELHTIFTNGQFDILTWGS